MTDAEDESLGQLETKVLVQDAQIGSTLVCESGKWFAGKDMVKGMRR